MISVIFAVGDTQEDENFAFGLNGGLPWGRPIKKDMENFKIRTAGSAVVMGRNTFESLPRPLQYRVNVVISSDNTKPSPKAKNGDTAIVRVVESDDKLEETLRDLESEHERVSVIGGVGLIRKSIAYADRVVVTYVERSEDIDDAFDYDVGMPKDVFSDINNNFKKTAEHIYFLDDYILSEMIFERSNDA